MSLQIGIIAPGPVPAVEGGAERLWQSLARSLEAAGHQPVIVTIPFPENDLEEILDGYEAFSELDVSGFDVVVTGKYPAWMVDHPRHVIYMLHPLRGLYDTYPERLGRLGRDPAGRSIHDELVAAPDPAAVLATARRHLESLGSEHPLCAHPGPLGRAVVHRLDALAFAPNRISSFAAISEEVAGRADYFPADRPVQVVHPASDLVSAQPSDADPECVPEGPVFFTASRHDRPKRIDLIIKAFRRLTDANNDRQLSLLIAGDGPERADLERAAGSNERIEFLGRVEDAELDQHYRAAAAVVFVPEREDFGYISLEAIQRGTPVLTTTDSGGARELIEDGVGGLVVEPTVVDLADAMDALADDPHRRWQLGLNGRRRAQGVRWAPLIQTIEEAAAPTIRPNVLIVSTFGVDPAVGGGQRRVRHLARALARHADVTVLALTNSGPPHGAVRRRLLEQGLTQIEVPRSVAHLAAEAEMTRVAGFPVDDITSGRLWGSTPAFSAELEAAMARADVIVAAHPFLAPAVKHIRDQTAHPTPFVYDAHNAETPFKTALLTDGAASPTAAAWLIEAVTEAETAAAQMASLITACTHDDLSSVLGLLSDDSLQATDVVANGVDTEAMALRSDTDRSMARAEMLGLLGDAADDSRPIATFIGSWHPPNLDAARLIIELAELRPDWLFTLAGSHTLEFDPSLVPPNVRLLPTFAEETLWPLLAGSDVALNPMVSGGGSNLKLYDYLAVGVPVLTTDIGARGLPDPAAVSWTAAADPQSLSIGLDEIMASDSERAARSAIGRDLVEHEVDWRLLGGRWAQAVLGVTDGQTEDNQTTAPDALRPRLEVLPPLMSTTAPPCPDPTVELMDRLGTAALSADPPQEMNTMNPTLRESLRRMKANRFAGRNLPPTARLQAPKRVLIRAGETITNEQLVFNEATIDTASELERQVSDLQEQLARLSDQVATLAARLDDAGPRD